MTIYTPQAPITVPGWKAKQAAAQAKRERNAIAPEVREARARLQAERDELREAQAEAERKARTRPLEAFREAVASVPDDALVELARYVGQLNPRDMADLAGEILNQRNRDRIAEAHRKPARAR